ncbi:hypothetical protein ACR9PT_03925 [Piscirickettsia salmonis]|uniref:hypothetical protein n=1 Tax=Piscirickettsia salmonis TaxID=1238 RepID=UPI003EBFFAD2
MPTLSQEQLAAHVEELKKNYLDQAFFPQRNFDFQRMLKGIHVDYEALPQENWRTLNKQLHSTVEAAAAKSKKAEHIQALFNEFNKFQRQALKAEELADSQEEYTTGEETEHHTGWREEDDYLSTDTDDELENSFGDGFNPFTDREELETLLREPLSDYLDYIYEQHAAETESASSDSHSEFERRQEEELPQNFSEVLDALWDDGYDLHGHTDLEELDKQAIAAVTESRSFEDEKDDIIDGLIYSFMAKQLQLEFKEELQKYLTYLANPQSAAAGSDLDDDPQFPEKDEEPPHSFKEVVINTGLVEEESFLPPEQWDELEKQASTIRAEHPAQDIDTISKQLWDKVEDAIDYAELAKAMTAKAERQTQQTGTYSQRSIDRASQSARTTRADWATAPSLLPGHPARSPQPQTTTAAAQQPAPAQQGEPSPGPSSAAPAPQQGATGAQLTAPSVQLNDRFLQEATRRFKRLTGQDTVTCEFDDQKTKLIAKEAGKEIASVKVEQSDKGTSIQHDGKGPTRQLAASAAAVTLLANPGAKIKVISTGDVNNTKIEYQALINAGVTHDQLDLAGLPTELLDDIKKMQPQRPQRPSGAQFAIGPFERAAKAAGSQKQPAAATPTHIPVGHSPNA